MKILGLNGWTVRGHDGGASFLDDGKLKFAIEEERLVGLRHAYDMTPKKSIEMILNNEQIVMDDIDKIAIGWNYPELWKMFGSQFISKSEVSKELFGTDAYSDKIEYVDHHVAHACSAFYPSGFNKALVLVLDGQGEYIATSVFIGDKSLKVLKKVYETPISLGYFYAAVTEHIGFHSGQEGKTMGLAPFGKPVYLDVLKKYLYADEDGKIHCCFTIKKKSKDEEKETIETWSKLLSRIIDKRCDGIAEINEGVEPYANLASSCQKLLEDILTKIVVFNCRKYNVENVAIAGGVGLNCAASGILSELSEVNEIFTQPAANDGGISLGSAIKIAVDNGEMVEFKMNPYQGNSYTDEDIFEFIKKCGYKYTKSEHPARDIAELIANEKIVANFQGRLEFGPRALGNRSLIADPRKKDMWIKLNALKGRELWRPLAPAILFEKQGEFFASEKFSPYMTINSSILKEKQKYLEAVTHKDGTARIQSVTKEYNPMFYSIIKEFYNITGIPVVINTSFNIKGEPIVATPEKALQSAIEMKLDYLAIGNYIINLKS